MLTERVKKYILFVVLLAIVSFLLFNFRVFVTTPAVVIYDFEQVDTLVVESDSYTIAGVAEGSKNLYINDKEVLLNIDASFSDTLYLSPYQNVFFIQSLSKTGPVFEREIQIYRQ